MDSSHYTNWTNLISDLASKGIKTLTYINPLFSNVSLRGTPYQHNYYEEGLTKDYFVHQSDGSVWTGYSNSTLADLSNSAAYQWMVDMIVQVCLSALPPPPPHLFFLFYPNFSSYTYIYLSFLLDSLTEHAVYWCLWMDV